MTRKTKTAQHEKRFGQASTLFGKGMRLLHKGDFQKAAGQFSEIVESFPEQSDILDRARSYVELCARQKRRPNSRPKEFEDMLHRGVYLHNEGDFEGALKLLNQAAAIHPRNEHVLYCLAATQAQAGDSAAALKALKSAITANEEARAQARIDPDFEALRNDAEFGKLTALPEL